MGRRVWPRPSWAFVILVALILFGFMFAVSPSLRNEVAEWVGRQLNPQPMSPETPVPQPVVVIVNAPTTTSTPVHGPDSVATIVAMALTSTAVHKPTPTLTPRPTVTSTVTSTPTPIPTEYRIDSVTVRSMNNGQTEWSVTVTKIGAGPYRSVPIQMSVNGGPPEPIAFVAGLETGESETYVFDRKVAQSEHSVILTVGDASHEVVLNEPTVTPAHSTIEPTRMTAVPLYPSPIPDHIIPVDSSTPEVVGLVPNPERVVPQIQATPTPTPLVPTPVATPQVVTPGAQLAPHLKHIELKRYMLELINAEREKVGLNHLELGQNNAAQRKADAALKGCHSSHWDLNGLNPVMHYHLAGGYQSMGENASGGNWCLTEADGYAPIRDVRRLVEQYMDSWMDSPAHRGSVLYRWHKKVNIGLAWDRYNSVAYQQFEGDYVEYTRLPSIENGILSFSGRTKPPVRFRKESDLSISLQYHQPPRALTVGQIMSVYSYGTETHVASFRWPLKPGWGYPGSEFSYTHSYPLDPYDLPADAPIPRPFRDLAAEYRKKHGYELTIEKHVTVPWVTALEWVASDDTFHFKADITDLLAKYGPGVYRVTLGGPVSDDEVTGFSSYSFFHEIEGYD